MQVDVMLNVAKCISSGCDSLLSTCPFRFVRLLTQNVFCFSQNIYDSVVCPIRNKSPTTGCEMVDVQKSPSNGS